MNMFKSLITYAVLLLLFAVHSASATVYTVNSVPNPYQQREVIYVVDPEQILEPADTSLINQRLKQLEQYTTIETVVVALPSIGQMDTREFANKLFNHWQIGKEDKDNGLLILLVIDQRQVVFEVGYGLEGNLTDAKSYRLMDEYMLPRFKQNQFSQGMVEGVEGVAKYLEQQFADGTLYTIGNNSVSVMSLLGIDSSEDLGIKFYILIIIAILVLIYSLWGDRIFMIKDWSTAQYVSPIGRLKKALLFVWAWSIVVMIVCGIFDINEDTIMWLVKIFAINSILFVSVFITSAIFNAIIGRKNKKTAKKLICPNCRRRSIVEFTKNKLHRLNHDEQYLMNIGGVTYRLFDCKQANCQATFKGSKINVGWKMCPDCQLPTNHLINSTRVAPTYSQSGLQTNYYHCVKCQKDSIETKILPRKQHNSSSGGGSSSGGSSGGSRGGGSSGGGGSRGSF